MTFQSGLNFSIEGGKTLSGSVLTSRSKNGAVALLAASILNKGTTTLTNMSQIEEVYRLVEVLRSIGMKIVWDKNTLTITPPEKFSLEKIDCVSAMKTRSILLFTGPLLHFLKSFLLPQSGG